MTNLIKNVFRLHPGESRMVLVLGFILFANFVAMQISGVVAISGFLDTASVDQILIVWIIDMILILATTAVQSLIVDRYNRISLLSWISFGFGVAFVILRMMFVFGSPSWLNYSLLYLLSDQQWIAFPVVFWLLANDMMDMAQAKRLLPLIGSLSFFGDMVGLGLAAFLPNVLENAQIARVELLSINILLYLFIYLIVVTQLPKVKLRQLTPRQETISQVFTEGWAFIKEIPAFRFLTIMILGVFIVEQIIEFYFLSVTDQVYTDMASYQTFYSLYRMGRISLAILIEGLLTSRLISGMGLKSTFLVLPIALLVGIGGILLFPGLVAAVGAMLLMRLSKDTIHDSSERAFQALVPEERRGRVSIFMDSYLLAIGTIIGALLVGGLLLLDDFIPLPEYTPALIIGLLIAGVAAWAVWKMRAVYDSSLLNWRLKRRQRGASVLDKIEF